MRLGALARTAGPGRTAAAALVCAAVLAWAAAARAAPTIDDQVYAIARDLMCPVCAGQTVAESNSQLAEQMRAEIRRRLLAGQSREEIIAYFVGQFGEGALAAPPPRGSALVLWLSLPVALLAGALILRGYLRRGAAAPRPTSPPPPTPDEAEQIERTLRSLDDSR